MVVGKREDGYHDLKMIMVPINFYDVLEMEFAKQTTLELNRDYLPINDKNTIIKAIHIMQESILSKKSFAVVWRNIFLQELVLRVVVQMRLPQYV